MAMHAMQQILSPRPQSVVSTTTQVSDISDNANTRTGPYLEGNLKLQGTIETSTSDEVLCCKFSNDGQFLAVGLTDGSIKIYNPHTCHCMYSLKDEDTLKTPKQAVTQIRFRHYSQDEKTEYSHILFATYSSGYVKTWHFTSGKCLHTINETRQTLCMDINSDGSRFVTAGNTEHMHLYDEETKTRISTLGSSDSRDKMDGHKLRVYSVQYHPNYAHVFISGGWDNTVHFWDDRQKHSVRFLSGPHICGDTIDIDAVHNHILTGSWRSDNVLQIWDFASAQKIKDIPPDPMYKSMPYSCQWLGKDSIICGGSEKNMARVIDRGTLNTTGHLGDLLKSVYCIDNDRKGNSPLIAIGCANMIFLVKSEKKS